MKRKPTNALYQIMETFSESDLKKMKSTSKRKLSSERRKKSPSKTKINAFKRTQSYIEDILKRKK